MKQIPFALPDITEEEITEVSNTLRSGWLTMGKKTIEFEKALEEYTGAKYAVAVNSCTAALHLSLLAIGIKPGDEVITTPLTFAATANAIVHCGARPVFADIDPETYNINPDEIEKRISCKTKAIIPVHYAGQPCDMRSIFEIADNNRLYVIEDAAHAIGATYHNVKIGNLESISTCFSFYATKNMTTGEGGAITTDNRTFAEDCRNLRLHGMSKDAWKRYGPGQSWKYDILNAGWKYNTTDINATLGVCQLRKLDSYNNRRRYLAGIYTRKLCNHHKIKVQSVVHEDHVQHLYPIQVPNRDTFIEKMSKLGVSCSVHFIPLHLTTYYQKTFGYRTGDFPICEQVYKGLVSLPLYPKMTDNDVMYVVDCVKSVVGD
jgi:dTDP-4-amino-4,6-dideoxygalactose transaminase